MSHIRTRKAAVRQVAALERACASLGLSCRAVSGHYVGGGRQVSGFAVRPTGWTVDAVFEFPLQAEEPAQVHYNNESGYFGADQELDRLLDACTVEEVRMLAESRGLRMEELGLNADQEQVFEIELEI